MRFSELMDWQKKRELNMINMVGGVNFQFILGTV